VGRSQQRRAALSGGIIAILSVILAITLVSANRIAQARRQAETRLSKLYLRNGAASATAGNGEEALMYLCEALAHDRDNSSARAATAMLLHRFSWLYEKESLPDSEAQSKAFSTEFAEPTIQTADDSRIITVVCQDGVLQVPRPVDVSPCCLYFEPDDEPEICLYRDPAHCRLLVNYGGFFYVYDFDAREEGPTYRQDPLWKVDLAELMPQDEYAVEPEIESTYPMRASKNGGLAAIGTYSLVIVNVLECRMVADRYADVDDIQDIVFRPDGKGYGLVYHTATDASAGTVLELEEMLIGRRDRHDIIGIINTIRV